MRGRLVVNCDSVSLGVEAGGAALAKRSLEPREVGRCWRRMPQKSGPEFKNSRGGERAWPAALNSSCHKRQKTPFTSCDEAVVHRTCG